MSELLNQVLAANGQFSDQFDYEGLTPFPKREFAILTCMDARLDPFKFAGFDIGDAHVIRNAGGRASEDAIRSLVFSYKLLGTKEWFVVHHTGCGLERVTNQEMTEFLASSLETVSFDGEKFIEPGGTDGSTEAEYIDWMTFENTTISLIADIKRLRHHPLVPGRIPIYGFVYDCDSGRLNPVPEAMELGKPTV